MNGMVPVAMFGWIPVALGILLSLPIRKGILAAYLAGWLFLPQASYEVAGLPDYTRMTAVNGALLLFLLMIDGRTLLSQRPRWFDLPMLVWCLCPIPTSVTNDLGVYDGLSGALEQLLAWGVPYWIGRCYFNDWASVRLLAIAVFIGGLIYVPLCLFEIRMSPQLHRWVYGYHRAWGGERLGGYRPAVFLNTGLELGLWMSATALVGIWLWRTRALRELWGVPAGVLSGGLFVTTVLCRSLGSLALLLAALAALSLLWATRWRWVALAFFLLPAAYVAARAPQVWSPQRVVGLVESFDAERARSLASRLNQEEVLTARAWQQPWFGWGGYGRNRVLNEFGVSSTVTDALWLITFGIYGLTGLAALGLALALPGLLLWQRLRVDEWWSPVTGPAVALAFAATLYALDGLMNAMLNPIYHLMLGAVTSVAVGAGAQAAQTLRVRRVVRVVRPAAATAAPPTVQDVGSNG